MKGKRIFDRFGFNSPKKKIKQKFSAKLLSNYNEWEYNSKTCDWENVATGELLSGYEIPSHLQAILANGINEVLF